MQFTPEHEQISDTVRKFVANEINPLHRGMGKGRPVPGA
jgi:hypothetical protein